MRICSVAVLASICACTHAFTPSPPEKQHAHDDAKSGEGEGANVGGEGEGANVGEGEGASVGGEGEGSAVGEGEGGGEGEGSSTSACAVLQCDNGSCVSFGGAEQCHCSAGFHASLDQQACIADSGTACDGVSCGDHGNCTINVVIDAPQCACEPGTLPYGYNCVDERRLGCRDAAGNFQPRGTARCDATDTHLEVCSDGDGDGLNEWIFGADCVNGGSCAQNCLGVGCDVQPCPVGTACVPSAHGEALNVCVATCDCSNCGNCGPDNSDHRWDDEQEQCGAAPNASPATTTCNMPCPDAGSGCIPYDPPICWPIEGCFSK